MARRQQPRGAVSRDHRGGEPLGQAAYGLAGLARAAAGPDERAPRTGESLGRGGEIGRRVTGRGGEIGRRVTGRGGEIGRRGTGRGGETERRLAGRGGGIARAAASSR